MKYILNFIILLSISLIISACGGTNESSSEDITTVYKKNTTFRFSSQDTVGLMKTQNKVLTLRAIYGNDVNFSIRDDNGTFKVDSKSGLVEFISEENKVNGETYTFKAIANSEGKEISQNISVNILEIQSIPNDIYYEEQWYLEKNLDLLNSIDDDAHIHINDLSKIYTGKGVKIAVIDNGLDTSHEDLQKAVIKTFDITSRTDDVSHNDGEYHGTAVTGIIAAKKNDIGIKGVANNADIIFLKYKDTMSDSETIELFNKAKNFGASIINCSWGTGNVSPAVRNTIIDLSTNARGGKGISIVFASGNGDGNGTGKDMGNDEANIAEVISVGSSNEENKRSTYSDYGVNLDILAPGGKLNGIGLVTLDNNNKYTYMTGTSAAAPIVSGVIALMLEKNPTLSRIEIENVLKNNTEKIANSNEHGRNNKYGYGKINLGKIIDYLDEIQ